MRSLFIAVVFSVLALGCADNQFVPANQTATLGSGVQSQSEFFTLAEDGEYEIITADSVSSDSVQAKVEKEKNLAILNTSEATPKEALDDKDFGDPKAKGVEEKEDPKAGTIEQAENEWHDFPSEPTVNFPGAPEDVEDQDGVALPTMDVPKAADIAFTSRLHPTVYYFPVINEDKRKCNRNYILRDEEGDKMLSLCESTRASCRLQGSCAIIQDGKKRTFNIKGNFNGKDRFFETSKDMCRFGFGVKSSCLDPFYTVAADLSIYRPGDVIYVPVARGIELPDGSKHSGYFLVRDTGRNIIGKARFDFFTGHIPWRDDENPFSNAGLANKANRFQFMKIKGAKAKAFSSQRSYPKLPVDIVKH
ncbi:3D domain protein [compost metagenome]